MVNINQNIVLSEFSKFLGVPDSEKRLTFEIFAKELSQRVEIGDQLLINRLGYFSIKKVKLNHDNNNSFQDVVLFSKAEITQRSADVLFFLMPDEQTQIYPLSDSYLNLSINKPAINILKDDHDIYHSHAEHELISLIESKIDKLFYESEILRKSSPAEEEFSLQFLTGNEISHADELPLEKSEENKDGDGESGIPNEKISDAIDLENIITPSQLSEHEDFINEEKLKVGLIFDDFSIQKEIEAHEDNVEIKENFSEETESEEKDLRISEDDEIKLLPRKKKKRKSYRLVYAFAWILCVGILFIIVYLNFDRISYEISKISFTKEEMVVELPKIEPVIVVRQNEDQWVISYPEVEVKRNMKDDSLILDTSVFGEAKIDQVDSSQENAVSSAEIVGNLEESMVADNIYKLGTEYIVQVSSWKSKAKAEREKEKIQLKGYQVRIVEFSSSSFGTVYRVRVGGFKSLSEANKFLTLNK